jgi:hypothetical protein
MSESRGDSNWCTPCMGKPDQHATRFPRSVHVWSMTIRISHGPHIVTFHTVVNRFEQTHCTREEGLPSQSTSRRPSDLRVCTQLLSHNSQRAVRKSQAPVDNRLLGLPDPYHRHAISMFNTCSRGLTERSLIDTGGGYNIGGVGLPHTHSPIFPTNCPHFSLMAPPGLHFNQVLANRLKCLVFKEPMATTWRFDHSTIYRSLHLHLAIANDLSLVVEHKDRSESYNNATRVSIQLI